MSPRSLARLGCAFSAALILGACVQPAPPPAQAGAPPPAPAQQGIASYYGPGFAGRPTASGERFDPQAPTAAHRTLPLGTVARVTNLETGGAETVVINDRGPYVAGRVIDVSEGVAERLGMKEQGTAPVEVTPLAIPDRNLRGRSTAAAGRR